MIDFRIEYDDGVSPKRKGDYDKRITRKDRETGYYLVLPYAEHKISIGYLRISEIPALEALLKTFLLANNNRFSSDNQWALLWRDKDLLMQPSRQMQPSEYHD